MKGVAGEGPRGFDFFWRIASCVGLDLFESQLRPVGLVFSRRCLNKNGALGAGERLSQGFKV